VNGTSRQPINSSYSAQLEASSRTFEAIVQENQMEQNKKNPRILVVDDAPENLMIMESILSKDYSLKTFKDSSEALEYAFANPPDLILLDVMMPKIDGFEFCRRLKANSKVADVPVIFITSKTDVADEERGFAVGASDFIHKPISAPIVAARVKTHIKVKFMLDFLKYQNAHLQENAADSSTELATLKEFVWGSHFGKR
jgi:putative two-component system response regulator